MKNLLLFLMILSSPAWALSGPGGVKTVQEGGTGQSSYTDGQLLIGNSTGNTLSKSTLTGTANQVNVTNGSGSITLSTPQDIHTGASPTFTALSTGQGLYELYAMNQDLETTDAPTFSGMTFTGNVTVNDDTFWRIGTDGDTQIEYDENGSNVTTVTGANWFFNSVNVGIGDAAPESLLTVQSADSGVTPAAEGDEFFIEGSANAGMTIGSGTTSAGYINFGDNGDSNIGAIAYVHASNYMSFTANASERMRIDSSGRVEIGGTSSGSKFYVTHDTVGENAFYATHSNGSAGTGIFNHSATSFSAAVLAINSADTTPASFSFLDCYHSNFGNRAYTFTGDGQANTDGAWNATGADYAEFFSWLDGNVNAEDRVGFSIILDNGRIRKALGSDDKNKIIGVISAESAIVGNNPLNPSKKYLKNKFGQYVLNKNGEKIRNPDLTDKEGKFIGIDDTRRQDKKEYGLVGLLGQLVIRKGQPVNPRWIKMEDLPNEVELWLVR